MPKRGPLPNDPIDLARDHWRAHGWPDAADGMAAVTSIVRVQQLLVAHVEAVLRPLGLTFARYEVLMLLIFTRRGELPLGKIGERLQVHPASVTNAVDRLERDGLVRRARNPSDGRGVLAAITPAGRRLAGQATDVVNERVFCRLALDGDELAELYRLLKVLRRAEGDFVDGSPSTA
jgi:DNA-binding MarR family transcriptional regulator